MRRIMIATVLVFALIFGYAVAKSMADEMMAKSGDASEVTEMLGKAVTNSQGEDLGVITDFVSDPDGRISFAIITFGKYEDYPDGGRRVAVPSGAFSCDSEECMLHSTYAQLASSPVYIFKDELVDRQVAENIYRYFGLQPPWTEEETTQHEMTPSLPHDYDD